MLALSSRIPDLIPFGRSPLPPLGTTCHTPPSGWWPQVFKAMRNGVQPVAVKVLGTVGCCARFARHAPAGAHVHGAAALPGGRSPLACPDPWLLSCLLATCQARTPLCERPAPPPPPTQPPTHTSSPLPRQVDSRVNSGVIKAVSNADLMKEISILRACRDTNILQFQVGRGGEGRGRGGDTKTSSAVPGGPPL